METDNDPGRIPLMTKDCVRCNRPIHQIQAKYACNECKVAPVCIVCSIRDHVECDAFSIFDHINRSIAAMTEWAEETYKPNMAIAVSERCQRRQIIADIEDLLKKVDPIFAKCVKERYLKEAEEMELLLSADLPGMYWAFGGGLSDLKKFVVNQQSMPLFTLNRLNQLQDSFTEFKLSFQRLYDLAMSKNKKLVQVKNLLHSMSLYQAVEPSTSIQENREPKMDASMHRERHRHWSRGPVAVAPKNFLKQRQAALTRSQSVSEPDFGIDND